MYLTVEEEPFTRLDSFGSQTRHYFKRMLTKIEEAGYEYKVVNDDSSFLKFYHEMYKSYILQRFSDQAVLYEPRVLERMYSKGKLIIAEKDGQPAAGAIVYQEGNTLHMPFLGITDGSVEFLQEGAMFAVHYYLAQMAHSSGCKIMDFGRCRPFLSDGTLRYKLNWHMDVIPSPDVVSVFAVATPGETSQAIRFLQKHPHFYIAGGKCQRSDKPLTPSS